MNTIKLIEKYYKKDSDIYRMLINHSIDVMNKAVSIAQNHPELHADIDFIKEAAMLHDIGVYLTDAPQLNLQGVLPYICHGYLGREILESEGYPKHALVCERHTGTGLSMEQIVSQRLPIPPRDMLPITIEEQLICFADCFFSKTHLGKEKSVAEIRVGLEKFGENSVKQFDEWCGMFL